MNEELRASFSTSSTPKKISQTDEQLESVCKNLFF